MDKTFAGILAAFHAVILYLFAAYVDYDTTYSAQRYPLFQDVNIMIFVGFGFLMAFLHRNSLTTTSHSFLVASFVIPWAMLNASFWTRFVPQGTAIAVFNGTNTSSQPMKFLLGIEDMINADFCAGAILISFGAVVGKCSAAQLLVMAAIEVVVYQINVAVASNYFGAADTGGSMVIHAFGAYFGLAVSFVLEKRKPGRALISTKLNASTRNSDTLAMIGTLFLWCYWPSFNGAMTVSGVAQQRAVLRTFLSLASSCIVAFYACVFLYNGKFRMVEIQNSSLAGGVAMGTACDMFATPFGALLIGAMAGLLSVTGYRYISPWLESKFGLKDTCGIHNLHGMPGVLGGLVGAFVSSSASQLQYGADLAIFPAMVSGLRTGSMQSSYQLTALAVTVGTAVVAGACTGAVLAMVPGLEKFFDDSAEFLLEADEGDDPVPGAVGSADGEELRKVSN